MLKHLKRATPDASPPATIAVSTVVFSPHRLVAMTRATSQLKRLNHVASDVRNIIKAFVPEAVDLVSGSSFAPDRILLQKARGLFDVTMMFAMRFIFAALLTKGSLALYMQCDGSPTSGMEASVVVQYARQMGYSIMAKVAPDHFFGQWVYESDGQALCNIVVLLFRVWPRRRVVALSIGVGEEFHYGPRSRERYLRSCGDAWCVFRTYWLSDHGGAAGMEFPLATFITGWHHLWDNIVIKVLESLDWWDDYLTDLKACIAFLRMDTYRFELSDNPKKEGYDESYIKKKPTKVAHWRWQTLYAVHQWFLNASDGLRAAWSMALFKTVKMRARLRVCDKCMMSEEFWERLCVVWEIVKPANEIRTWGAGCPCHEAQRQVGQTLDCPEQGLNLPRVLGRLDEFLPCASRKQ